MATKKYLQIADRIEEDIQNEVWTEKLPGVTSMASHYGVAVGTLVKAVNVLSEKGLIANKGPRGTFIARRSNPRPRTGIIGLVGASEMDLEASGNKQCIRNVVAHHREKLITLGTKEELQETEPSFFGKLPVDGLVFIQASLRKDIIVELLGEGMPFVSVNRVVEAVGCDWVDYDGEAFLRESMRFLVENGHERIAVAGFRMTMPGHQEYLDRIYAELLAEHDLPALPDYWRWQEDVQEYRRKYGSDAAVVYGERLAEDILRIEPRPSALLVPGASLTMQKAILKRLQEKGLDLPGELALVGSATEFNEPVVRQLSLVAYGQIPTTERFERAVEQLFQRIDQPDLPPQQSLLDIPLVKLD